MSEPAFPGKREGVNNEPPIVFNQGMSLRDYLAAKAMLGMLSGSGEKSDIPDPDYINNSGKSVASDISTRAYKFADAMLEERKKLWVSHGI